MGTVPACDCHSARQLERSQEHTWNNITAVFDGLECLLVSSEDEEGGVVSQRRARLDDEEILELLNCEGTVIQVGECRVYRYM